MNALLELLTNEANRSMQYELAAVLLCLLLSGLKAKDRKSLLVLWGALFAFLLYLHRILLPFLVSGFYVSALLGAACVLYEGRPGAFFTPLKKLRGAVLSLTAVEEEDRGGLAAAAVILLVLLIQLLRINIAIDYDSFRYGLRSPYLLTDGSGPFSFFRSLGLLNTVYTYPKGFELLTLPLFFGHTFGYVLCFNVWMLLLLLYAVSELTRGLTGSGRAGWCAAAGAALMPGITNMALTAKSDLATAVLQLAFYVLAVRYIRAYAEGRAGDVKDYPAAGAAALILSLSFKPTALLFSSAAGLFTLCWFLLRRIPLSADRRGARLLLFSLLFTGAVTLRTLLITGVPFTSVYTGVFERLGFRLKYPFSSQYMFSGGDGPLGLSGFLSRLLRFLFCPVGEDMAHVVMAWGGFLFLFFLFAGAWKARAAVGAARGLSGLKALSGDRYVPEEVPEPESLRYAAGAFAKLIGVSLFALGFAGQVDGNYFILLYAFSAAFGTAAVCALRLSETLDRLPKAQQSFSAFTGTPAVLAAVIMIYFTAFTGWAGAVGFTPPDLLNRGYYNHEAELGIENPMGLPRDTRLVAFADEPACWLIPCRTEAWVDLDGSGGNVYLTDTKLDKFKEYLSFADIDYIYADLDWLRDPEPGRHGRARTLFIYLLEDSCFEEIALREYSTHELYAKIDKERMAVSWETERSAQLLARTEAQCGYFREIGGYR